MKDITSLVDAYANKTDTDVLAYLGDIESGYDDFTIDLCRNRKLRKNVLLVLTTSGGDPNAAYRIARCLQ